jgi:thiamine-phosphate pyrophosphorylase
MTGARRRARLRDARLYVCMPARPDLDSFLDAVLGAGVDVVQLRDKVAGPREQLDAARAFRAACDRHGALFVVNDRVDLAIASGADGVHLGQEDLLPAFAREIAGPDLLIGRSTHTARQIAASNGEPVDYIAVGPVFETPTKPGRPSTGTALLRRARDVSTPWFAIGGIDATTVGRVVAVGATRVVVVRAIVDAEDPAIAAKELRSALEAT